MRGGRIICQIPTNAGSYKTLIAVNSNNNMPKIKKSKPAKAAKPAVRRVKTATFFSALKAADETKLSPQAFAIVSVLSESGRIGRKELISRLKSKLKSSQEPSRVLSYYKKNLVADRFIKVEKEAVEQKVKAAAAATPTPPPPAQVVVEEPIAESEVTPPAPAPATPSAPAAG